MYRNSAMAIKLDSKIIDIIIASKGCFVYTEDKVYKIRTPEEIDPDNQNDSIPFENTIYRKSGTMLESAQHSPPEVRTKSWT